MVVIPDFKNLAIRVQRVNIDVIHAVILNQHSIIAGFTRIPYHFTDRLLSTMIVAFVVAFEGALKSIPVDVYRLVTIVSLWNVDAYYIPSFNIDCFYILIAQKIGTYLLAVYGVPKICKDLSWIIHSYNCKSFEDVFFMQVL